MKAILVTALLASATALTAAAPAPPTPPPPPSVGMRPPIPASTCGAAAGTIEVQLDNALAGNADPTHYDLTTSTTTLYTSGAWTYTELRAGKQVRTSTGCLVDSQRKTIHADLARATWKLMPLRVHCNARSLNETIVSSAGKQLYVGMTCPSATLDDVSAKALAEITATLDDQVNPHPPCCKP